MADIIAFDQWLFQVINQQWQAPWLDTLLPVWREKTTWIPLYLILMALVIYRFRWRAVYFAIGVAVTIGLADTLSSKVVKPGVERLRPCNQPDFKQEVQLRIDCGPGYSFTSSHATNHFALAVFLMLTLGSFYRWMTWPLLLWAATIAYAQVYVGVHYPLDVLAGAGLGAILGALVAKLYMSWQKVKLTLP